tara:strand:+ start:986 stop:2803 length:1818 start_codon:yes stop_codon:yes gene_type:complete
MSDKLLPYYNRELSYIRRLGSDFAKANPKIAGHLNMTEDTIEDPHVSRLVEAFALLNARTRQKLDDDFPELTDSLLNVLYPHYLAPIPSMAMVQLKASRSLQEVETVKRHTMLETGPIQGEPCRFQTAYDVDLLPAQVTEAELEGHRRNAPDVSNRLNVSSVLKLKLDTYNKTFAELKPKKLRFFLKGQHQQMFALYEMLMKGVVKIAMSSGANDPDPVFLDAEHLQAVGLNMSEGLLPYPAQSFLGYRLLTEFFTFPEKFLFLDLVDLPADKMAKLDGTVELYLYLTTYDRDLEQHVDADNFAMGCTPMVNLFKHRAEPLTVKHTEPEYHIIADVQRPMAYEIYRINNVTAIYNNGKQQEFAPFYGVKHNKKLSQHWYATRQPAKPREGELDNGTEMFISLVDLEMRPSEIDDCIIDIETLSCNRDLPSRLPFGGNQPYLQFSEVSAPVEKIQCLTPPTPTFRQPMGEGAQWRLISHLSLNHLSLTDDKVGREALQEILRLYDVNDSAETRAMIDSILSLSTKRTLARDPSGGLTGFCQGIEITLELDDERFTGSSVYLFASIIERFLALYCSINSFTKLVAVNKGKQKVIHAWPPRSGEQTLI